MSHVRDLAMITGQHMDWHINIIIPEPNEFPCWEALRERLEYNAPEVEAGERRPRRRPVTGGERCVPQAHAAPATLPSSFVPEDGWTTELPARRHH